MDGTSLPYTFFCIERRDAETAEKNGREREEKKIRNFNNALNSLLSASPRLCVQNQNKNVCGSEDGTTVPSMKI
jgi:hypothetical protein